jgi:DNA polymerase II small subunit/DNA polymerase delta subunit B
MLLNSETPEDLEEESKALSKIKQSLEMRHLCPTAPDTLRVYPFKDSDPFVINSLNNCSNLDLNVGEDENGPDQSLYT